MTEKKISYEQEKEIRSIVRDEVEKQGIEAQLSQLAAEITFLSGNKKISHK